MGLLEKAMRLKQGRPTTGVGLLGRALRLQEEPSPDSSLAASGSAPREVSRSARREAAPNAVTPGRKPGLFERARRIRESAQASGLLGRALRMRDEPQPASSRRDGGEGASAQMPDSRTRELPVLTEAEASDMLFGPDTFPGTPAAREEDAPQLQAPGERAADSLPPAESASEAYAFPEDDDSVELPELDETIESPAPATAAPDLEASPGAEFPPMDFAFLEQSAPEQDPGLQEEESEGLPDPFHEWQEEAGRDAERHTRDLLGQDDERLPPGGEDAITTMPVETHIASQKRIDNYLSLFELNRELNAIDQPEEFWDSVVYSILGQIGARSVVVFAARAYPADSFAAVASSGVRLSDDWVLQKGDVLCQAMAESEEIRYAGEFLGERSGISSQERHILEECRAALLVPLKHGEQYDGIIVVGPPLESVDYVIDDLEFLKLLSGTLLGSLRRILGLSRHAEETVLLETENRLHRSLASMTASAQTRKTIDEIYDLLLEFFANELGVESLSLVLLDPPEQQYRIFAGNRVSPASLQRFRLPVGTSELIGTVSNLSGIYDLVDFRHHPEIVAGYAGDDLALMQKYLVLPLINLNWLVGFVTVHRQDHPWTGLEREIALNAANQMAAVLANCIILKERETLFRDPFSPLEKRLERELQKAMEFHAFLSIVVFNVRNLKKLLGANGMAAMTEFFLALSRTISRNLYATDYMTRTGAGRFVLLLPGRGRAEAGIFAERLQIEMRQTPLLRGSAVAPAYECEVINFPDDADSMQKLIALLDH